MMQSCNILCFWGPRQVASIPARVVFCIGFNLRSVRCFINYYEFGKHSLFENIHHYLFENISEMNVMIFSNFNDQNSRSIIFPFGNIFELSWHDDDPKASKSTHMFGLLDFSSSISSPILQTRFPYLLPVFVPRDILEVHHSQTENITAFILVIIYQFWSSFLCTMPCLLQLFISILQAFDSTACQATFREYSVEPTTWRFLRYGCFRFLQDLFFCHQYFLVLHNYVHFQPSIHLHSVVLCMN